MNAFLAVIGAFLFVVGALYQQCAAAADSDAADSSVALTRETYDELTAGKTVFIKFFAPWCGHCQALQPDWEKLAKEWLSHNVGLVASVDCSTQQDLCEDFDIQGLPTLLYGDPSQSGVYLHEYRGDKSYASLSQFAKQNISKPMCSPANVEPCEPNMRKQIESILKMNKKQLDKAIQKQEKAMEKAETTFAKEFQKMQTKYDKVAADHAAKEARIRQNIKMIQAVIQTKTE